MPENGEKPKAFVIMPFDDEFDDVYSLISEVVSEAGFSVSRADNLDNHQNIIKDIIQAISAADLIIADLTALNPNVFYELGIAHSLRKKVVMLTQDVEYIPFDLRAYRIVSYNTHFAKIKHFKDKLLKSAQGALNAKIKFESPITDSLLLTDHVNSSVSQLEKKNEVASELVQKDVVDEDGYFDHLVHIETGFDQLTEIVREIAEATETIGTEFTKQTEELDNVAKNPSSGTASYVRKKIGKVGSKLTEYSKLLKTQNKKYSTCWETLEESLEFIITFPTLKDETDIKKLTESITSIDDLLNNAIEARNSMALFQKATSALKGFERHLNQAVRSTERELGIQLDNLDKTISSLNRLKILGNQRLTSLS